MKWKIRAVSVGLCVLMGLSALSAAKGKMTSDGELFSKSSSKEPGKPIAAGTKFTVIRSGNIFLNVKLDSGETGYVLTENAKITSDDTVRAKNGSIKAAQKAMLAHINAERKKKNLEPVKLDTTLNKAAAVRAKEIVKKFEHTRLDGAEFRTILDEMEVKYRTCSENISAGDDAVQLTMERWMASKGHCANILDPDVRKVGIGYVGDEKSDYKHYWVQIYTD
jgi:Uncharacterized protein with SCP/PR1 domains